jgi:hypothetical protein
MIATKTKMMTTQEVASRFNELAQQEKWFEIHDELFADDVRSVEPPGSPYMPNAEGKAGVRKKAEEFISRITGAHRFYTSEPLVCGNHFTVAREKELTVTGHGRIEIKEIMLYEVKDGKIVLEQFFY